MAQPDQPAQTLVEEFYAKYRHTADNPDAGPDPTLAELVETEDQLSETVVALEPMELTEEEKADVRGLRAADLPDLMADTAEALRACPEIAADVHTAPEVFEQVSRQDIAASALINVLGVLHNGVDTGLLLRGADAEKMLDAIDAQVHALRAPGDAHSPAERVAIESIFTDAITRRLTAQKKMDERLAGDKDAVAEEKDALKEAGAREESALRVRYLIERALALAANPSTK